MLFRVTHDQEVDVAYVYLVPDATPGPAVRQESVPGVIEGTEIIVDFDASGRMRGIEVLGASLVLAPEILATATDRPRREAAPEE